MIDLRVEARLLGLKLLVLDGEIVLTPPAETETGTGTGTGTGTPALLPGGGDVVSGSLPEARKLLRQALALRLENP